MAKRWVSLLGPVTTLRAPPYGYPPEAGTPDNPEPSNGGFYGRWDEQGTPFYSSRVFMTGRPQTLLDIAGLAVRGVRWTLNVRAIAAVSPGTNKQFLVPTGPNTYRFGDADTPRLRFLIAGVPVDLDGAGMSYILGEQVTFPRSTAASGSRWFGVPEGWVFSYNGVHSTAGAGTGTAHAQATEAGYAMVASRSLEETWPFPAGLMRQPTPEDWTQWPGGVVFFDSLTAGDPRAAAPVSAAFSRLDVLVSEKPTWVISSMNTVVERGAENQLTGRLYYPDELDGVAGLPLHFSGSRIELRLPGSPQWLSALEVTSDNNGDFTVFYRGTSPGNGQITFGMVSDDGVDRSRLFSPRLNTKVQDVIIIPSSHTPPVPDPGTGVVCVTTPGIPPVIGSPPRVEYVPTFAWDAGANSIDEHEGDCFVRWDMQAVIGVACGLTNERGDVTDLSRITHGFMFSTANNGRPQFDIIESGRTLGMLFNYLPGDEFEIRRVGGVVTYRFAGELFHESGRPSTGTVIVTSSLYGTGDQLPTGAGGAPPPPPPPHPDEVDSFVFEGTVPPDAEQLYLLAAGEWTFTEDASGASCDWRVIVDGDEEGAVAGIEGASETVTFDEATPAVVRVSAYQTGGPFRLTGVLGGAPGPTPGWVPFHESSVAFELWTDDGAAIGSTVDVTSAEGYAGCGVIVFSAEGAAITARVRIESISYVGDPAELSILGFNGDVVAVENEGTEGDFLPNPVVMELVAEDFGSEGVYTYLELLAGDVTGFSATLVFEVWEGGEVTRWDFEGDLPPAPEEWFDPPSGVYAAWEDGGAPFTAGLWGVFDPDSDGTPLGVSEFGGSFDFTIYTGKPHYVAAMTQEAGTFPYAIHIERIGDAVPAWLPVDPGALSGGVSGVSATDDGELRIVTLLQAGGYDYVLFDGSAPVYIRITVHEFSTGGDPTTNRFSWEDSGGENQRANASDSNSSFDPAEFIVEIHGGRLTFTGGAAGTMISYSLERWFGGGAPPDMGGA